MASERDFPNVPQDLQQFLLELQVQERIRDLQGRYWRECGGASRRELVLLREAYLTGLADGLEEAGAEDWSGLPDIKPEPEKRKLIMDKTLQAVLSEYQAVDHAMDRLIGLVGKAMQDYPEKVEYRKRLNEILYELNRKVSESRGRYRDGPT
jgi:hypothetical protein